jgi:hypothetical protein
VYLLVFALTASILPVAGQTSLGGVNGTVTGGTGAVIPVSTVRLTAVTTGIEVTAQTNESGYFAFVNVRPGDYALSVELQGFRSVRVPAFNVAVGQTVTQNITLQVGEVAQSMEVGHHTASPGVLELVLLSKKGDS